MCFAAEPGKLDRFGWRFCPIGADDESDADARLALGPVPRLEQDLQHLGLVAQADPLGVRAADPGADLDPDGAVGRGVLDDLVHQAGQVVRTAQRLARGAVEGDETGEAAVTLTVGRQPVAFR